LRLRHILAATDESAAGRQAVRAGLEVAARASARLTILRVVSFSGVPLLGPSREDSPSKRAVAAGTARERLQRWLGADLPSAETGPPVELDIAFGVPAIEICRFAEQRGADLLVLGRKRRSAVVRLCLGDTADAVVRRSTVPCLLVQPDSSAIHQLLVALDGSERGMSVLAAARGFAEAVGAGIRVVTIEPSEGPSSRTRAAALPLTRSSRLRRTVEPIVARAPASRGSTEDGVAVRHGRVVPEILAEVEQSGPDVLAFGHHRGGPPGIIEGKNTARELAQTAPVSVLAIPL
jgi:nucleotide-binding universal stress UspA family protein